MLAFVCSKIMVSARVNLEHVLYLVCGNVQVEKSAERLFVFVLGFIKFIKQNGGCCG